MANSDNGIQLGEYLVEAISNEYGWKFPGEKHQAGDVIRAIQSIKGLPAALDWFIELKHSGSTQYQYGPGTLNNLGFRLMQAKNLPAAIKVFKLNVDEYPSNANAYDSLGEAYMNAGDKKLAIENYEKSLKLDPKNENAVSMLKKLRE